MTKIPSNYRQLDYDEIIRKGDLYQPTNYPTNINSVKYAIGCYVRDYLNNYTFWRRRHTKAITKALPSVPMRKGIITATEKSKKTVIEVSFDYPKKDGYLKTRIVQLISLDSRYLVGLEKTWQGAKPKYQFKKFLRNKICRNEIYLESFGPQSS